MLPFIVALALVTLPAPSVGADEDPTVNITAITSTVLGLNDDFSFSCSVDQPDFQITLFIDDEVESDKNKRINKTAVPDENAFVYIFKDTVMTDNGTTFYCAADDPSSSNDTFDSDILTLLVQWPPQLLSPVSVPAQTAGKTHLEISLNISANPEISYTLWKRNGKDIVNDTHILPRPDKLTFTSLLPTDNGSYTAEVFNSVGNLTIPFDVIVTNPSLVKITKVSGGNIGVYDFFKFNCSVVKNISNFSLVLMIDNKLNSSKSHRVSNVSTHWSYSFSFGPIQPSDNGTTFVCTVITEVKDSSSGTLTLDFKSKKKSKKSNVGGAIAAGVIVPLAVIALIFVGVAAFCYFRRKRPTRGFTLLSGTDDDGANINNPGGTKDRIIED